MPNLQILLSWDDPATGERREPRLSVPIAFGREFARLPDQLRGERVSRMLLNSNEVSRYHALIDWEQNQLVVIDQGSVNGLSVNGQRQTRSVLNNGDTLQIGPYMITVNFSINALAPAPVTSPPSTIHFNPNTNIPDPSLPSVRPVTPLGSNFPPPAFQAQQVDVQALHATGLPVDECDYLAVGAGLGSFIWTDLLRISGVRADKIVALGLEAEPYARYKRLCLNSQIPLYERLRSNSDSCPDNIWGWPSYALREAWHDITQGKPNSAFRYLWQVFAEPTFIETYTPRAGNVFDSIDRECRRIGWQQIYRYGRVRAIRKTADGRYCVAYSRGTRDYAFFVSRYLHLATGYPAIQFLPDLQAYREKYQDFKAVVNAYEEHDHVYQQLEQQGGIVLLRGRGIVASRIVQRIYEARKKNRNITVLHLMRSPKPQGNKFQKAQRLVKNHYEFQPFNWPKACWSGELRVMLEKATPDERKSLLADWGGTTTADRHDWQQITEQGLREGWYQITFGDVLDVERGSQNRTISHIREKGLGEMKLEADFIVDATGLDAKVQTNPLLDDLVKHYNLPLNHLGRLVVANNFELAQMRNTKGQMYAAGAITLGGPYAAVDSFLGLQYAALVAVEALANSRAPGVKHLNAFNSFSQWLKWVFNQSPI
ncbi:MULTISPECIES: FHA domain-containing protein [unclassified Tolypothrix]|uniref:FHA domain-containing protein n=1 Tax=unclassified Tolypothrix TaxID=2649714 RepID=UPI0005EAC751|nr:MULTISPECIES: FHA domain-containing protein [unclassified Tolypothrix]BAY90994.1 FHA domain protein [Microchaete diplosiphon NIES-3275]EKE99755.1 forkhead associated domain protein [Tolypothrix sp. PCC 7601]MBE9082514.1 FHA domain-containing protein [Tolypothrix sp. LEGE 11397]UYD25101.1 FHA domain-containing protein [Tolypothrix sp. PCC 7712]UYD32660.1 FHA domain-containing protein [Tolypothrix sp. PCC 7601]